MKAAAARLTCAHMHPSSPGTHRLLRLVVERDNRSGIGGNNHHKGRKDYQQRGYAGRHDGIARRCTVTKQERG